MFDCTEPINFKHQYFIIVIQRFSYYAILQLLITPLFLLHVSLIAL